ncbi:MAG: D-alanyl-D-alanine carboxypeptidase [Spirochaetaceae bacterium]|nr:MAG: D-alanyl-D-alanine carboxypeptidase [Spirochaetaceae bacterium]
MDRYPGADGLKTGYTSAAGYNLAATAVREGRRLVVVVLGIDAPDHIEGSQRRTADAITLLDWGFENFRTITPARPDPGTLKVLGGRERTVALAVPEPPPLVLPSEAVGLLRGEIELPDYAWAPLGEGERAGSVRYLLADQVLAEIPIVYRVPVEEGHFFRRLWDRLSLWFSDLAARFR